MLPMTSTDDSLTNLQIIKKSIEQLEKGTRLLCLPENSLFMNLDDGPIPTGSTFTQDSKEIQTLAQIAKETQMHIHLGGIPWLRDGQVFNQALLITDHGEITEHYEKIHLFDVDLSGIKVTESVSYKAGASFASFTIAGWKFATCICYDLRFPELFLHYMQENPVDAFLVPAAFTTKTGELHWKPLLTARAIESQAYVVAAAQVGYHRDLKMEKLRKSWGQSLVIDPWGRTVAETESYGSFLDSNLVGHEPIRVILERDKIKSLRRSIPVAEHRRFQMELKLK